MSRPASTRHAPISALSGAVARLLRAASLVLALLFVLRVLLSLGPLRSGPVAVALRFCDALVAQSPFAVMVVCLLGVALLIDEDCPSNRRLTRAVHAAAIPVAVGYLLLIPLYGTAHWWQAQAEAVALRQGLQASLDQIQTARQALLRASSSRDLETVLVTLPAGSPPLSRFGPDLPRQRSALLRFFDQVNGILAMRLQGLQRQLLTTLLRDTALFAFACLGLAALFHRLSQLNLSRRRLRLRLAPLRRGCRADPLQAEVQRLLRDSSAIEAPLQDAPDPAEQARGSQPSG
jgi:hypothetical protein